MVYSSKVGNFDFTRPKVCFNGRVLDKWSLIDYMRSLNSSWYWQLLYADEVYSYRELASMFESFLSGDSEIDF